MNRILVIEDDLAVRNNIVELLNEEGFETHQAENGKIGIEKAKQLIPDLIISDVLMPEADGHTVLNELQKNQNTAHIPFIFLTARTSVNDIRTGMNLGADDYLTKPYKAEDILSAINSRLRKTKNTEQRLNETLKSISMALPHEFRTPLISILGFSQIIKEDTKELSSEEINNMASAINTSGMELLNKIQKFLDLSRLEIFKTFKKHHKECGSNLKNIKDVISKVAKTEAEKSNRINDLFLKVENSSVQMLEDHAEILLKELIENAFKFSGNNKKVSISSVVTDENYAIKIKDFGIGMSREQINNIGVFKKFDQINNNESGLGLGLATAFKIAEIYDININIQSELNKSTTVKIFIPIKQSMKKIKSKPYSTLY